MSTRPAHAAPRRGRAARGLGRAGAPGLGVPAPGGAAASSPTWCCSSWSAAGLAHGSRARRWCSASAPGCCSTWRRPPTTSPAAGRSRCMVVGWHVAGRLRTAGPPVASRRCCGRSPALLVRRHVGVRAHRAGAARPGRRRRRAAARRGAGRPGWDVAAGAWSSYRSTLGLFASGRARPGPGVTARPRENRSRLRLVVIQALVFSLFATLLVRLYYLQVVTRRGVRRAGRLAVGPRDRRPAAARADRRRQGRPLVANRTSWVVSIDRGTLAKMPEDEQRALLRRVARVTDVRGAADPPAAHDVRRRRRVQGRLLERVAVPAGAGRGRRTPADGAAGARAARGLPGRDSPSSRACAPTRRRSASTLAHVLGYLSPITGEELDQAEEDGDRSVNGASVVGRAGVEKEYDAWLRGMPGYTAGRGRLDGAGDRRRRPRSRRSPATPS